MRHDIYTHVKSGKNRFFFKALIALFSLGSVLNCMSQQIFSDELAFLWKLKLDSIEIELNTEEFIYRFEKESYHLYKNDEFEMHAAKDQLVNMVNELPEKDIYTISLKADFSEYNFEEKGFTCMPFTPESNIQILDKVFGTRLETNNSVDLQFVNASDIVFFPMNAEKANMLLKERKNYKNGKIDRSIILNISFIVNGLSKTENSLKQTINVLLASILQIDFYDSNELSNEPISSISTPIKSEMESLAQIEQNLDDIKLEIESIKANSGESNSAMLSEISKIIANSSLNNEQKANLIQYTIEFYTTKNNQELTNAK